MAEGKTITIIQKGKKAPEQVTLKIGVSNMASPTITGASRDQISYVDLTVEVNDSPVDTGWDVQFGRLQAVTINVDKGSKVFVNVSSASYIPDQNLQMIPGWLCEGNNPFISKLISSIQSSTEIALTINKAPCI